jgi:hypothetical protein
MKKIFLVFFRVIKWLLNTTVSNMQALMYRVKEYGTSRSSKTDNKVRLLLRFWIFRQRLLTVFILTEILLLTLAQEKK